jgi:hypothetical protein
VSNCSPALIPPCRKGTPSVFERISNRRLSILRTRERGRYLIRLAAVVGFDGVRGHEPEADIRAAGFHFGVDPALDGEGSLDVAEARLRPRRPARGEHP